MRLLTVILGCLTVAATCPAQNWTQIKPSTSPSARAGHEMVYDSARQRTVLFGGLLSRTLVFLSDTWEWDGQNWAKKNPPNSPPARHSFAMAYDSVRQRTVLFGGQTSSAAQNDTWEWDGSNWTKMSPANAPTGRSHLVMAYDSVRQRTVLFSGLGAGADTWEWNGNNWTTSSPATSPGARFENGMAYDSARRRTVIFGGQNPTSLGDTWEWGGKNWMRITPGASPSARTKPAMAYDSARQRTVLFGGRWLRSSPNLLGDTWEWNGTNWARVTPAASPSARAHTGMAYDSVRQRTVLFGGQVGNNGLYSADTWEYGIAKLTLSANTPTIPTAGGTQILTLNAGTNVANKPYWIFGSMTGTMPGVVLTGIHIPLRPDPYTDIVIGTGNSKEFTNFRGILSAGGTATASLNVPANLPIPVGFKLYHSYIVYDATTGQIFTSSNPVSVEFK